MLIKFGRCTVQDVTLRLPRRLVTLQILRYIRPDRAKRKNLGSNIRNMVPTPRPSAPVLVERLDRSSTCCQIGNLDIDYAEMSQITLRSRSSPQMTRNDINEFEQNRVKQCLALGQDKAAYEKSAEVVTDLDRFDYSYLWTWLGLPIIQFPADIVATQEVIWSCKPDVIIETGVARGGSMIFLAAMMQLLGRGKVIGVDIDIRAHNREAIEAHPMSHRVVLIEGPSTSAETMAKVRSEIPDGAKVMVILDSDHSRDHVLDELENYGPLVTSGQYLVVADTVLGYLSEEQTPRNRSQVLYPGNDPLAAAKTYLEKDRRFEVDPVINGKLVLSSSPGGYLRCK